MDDMEEFFEEHQSGCLDGFAFASTRYIAFDRQTYGLMIVSIRSGETITMGALKAHDKRVDSKKHNTYGNDWLQTTRLAWGEEILRRYENDPSMIQMIDEAARLFKPEGQQIPSYGVPKHAILLLQAPTRILELQNVITKAALSMSEVEFVEIEDDVRTECKRFGNVKSTHIIMPETRPCEIPHI
ncbi:hypothetical protein L7F22_066685 [Adiantum nelumboides]|nr:hypothetical protein [Adiantum nelumboides]